MEQNSPRPAHTPSASVLMLKRVLRKTLRLKRVHLHRPAIADHESVQEGSAALESLSSYPMIREASAEDLMDFDFQDYAVPASSSTRTGSTEATSSEVPESPVPVSSSPVVCDDEDGESDTDQCSGSRHCSSTSKCSRETSSRCQEGGGLSQDASAWPSRSR